MQPMYGARMDQTGMFGEVSEEPPCPDMRALRLSLLPRRLMMTWSYSLTRLSMRSRLRSNPVKQNQAAWPMTLSSRPRWTIGVAKDESLASKALVGSVESPSLGTTT